MLSSIAKSNFDKLDKMKKEKLTKEEIKEAHSKAKSKINSKEKTR